MYPHFQFLKQPDGKEILPYKHQDKIQDTLAQLPQTVLIFHFFQLIDNNFTVVGSQPVTGTVLPQSVLVDKRSDDFIVIHKVGNDIAAFHIQ